GGGLYNRNTQQGATSFPKATAINATFSANTSTANLGDNIFNGHEAAAVSLSNTIVAAGSPNCNSALRSLGNNLDSATSCGFNASGDRINSDAKLSAPAFNGGPIPTLLTLTPQKGSQAIDKGNPSVCAALPINNKDQRGLSRPRDGDGIGGVLCDIGAAEADTAVGIRVYIPLIKR
ncbi:MAG TPA: choice-of-anchor Q domain-containing protein, partial [Herpetosiphonaceae bacterium]|nr:choice-of-anchor Q domain-containing protein [Herpetosiphonaceae bacterium]